MPINQYKNNNLQSVLRKAASPDRVKYGMIVSTLSNMTIQSSAGEIVTNGVWAYASAESPITIATAPNTGIRYDVIEASGDPLIVETTTSTNINAVTVSHNIKAGTVPKVNIVGDVYAQKDYYVSFSGTAIVTSTLSSSSTEVIVTYETDADPIVKVVTGAADGTIPNVHPGFIPLAVVTVAAGTTAITSAMIDNKSRPI
jgi:hypothetical protein